MTSSRWVILSSSRTLTLKVSRGNLWFLFVMVSELLPPVLSLYSFEICERWDNPKPNSSLSVELYGWAPRMNWYKQGTMLETSRTLCSSIIFKCHLTGPSQVTWFTGRKAVTVTIIIPIYCLLECESLGGQAVPKAQCSWALKVKFKGQQSGIGTMAKAQSFEMNRRANPQEITAKLSFTIFHISHSLGKEIRVTVLTWPQALPTAALLLFFIHPPFLPNTMPCTKWMLIRDDFLGLLA